MKKIKNVLLMLMMTFVFIIGIQMTASADNLNVQVPHSKIKKTITVGSKLIIKPIYKNKAVKKGAKFSSSKKAVATVSKKGVIKAKKAGKATITIKYKKKKTKIALTIVKKSSSSKPPVKKEVLADGSVAVRGDDGTKTPNGESLQYYNKKADGTVYYQKTNGTIGVYKTVAGTTFELMPYSYLGALQLTSLGSGLNTSITGVFQSPNNIITLPRVYSATFILTPYTPINRDDVTWTVTVNGKPVVLDESGSFSYTDGAGQQFIFSRKYDNAPFFVQKCISTYTVECMTPRTGSPAVNVVLTMNYKGQLVNRFTAQFTFPQN